MLLSTNYILIDYRQPLQWNILAELAIEISRRHRVFNYFRQPIFLVVLDNRIIAVESINCCYFIICRSYRSAPKPI